MLWFIHYKCLRGTTHYPRAQADSATHDQLLDELFSEILAWSMKAVSIVVVRWTTEELPVFN